MRNYKFKQLTVRLYSQEDIEILDKAYEKTQRKFDNQADFMRTCLITGAQKLLGDSKDYFINLSELKELLTEIKKEIKFMNCERKVDFKEQQVDNELMEKFLNYIAWAVYDLNKNASDNIDEGLVEVPYEKLKIMNEIEKTNG